MQDTILEDTPNSTVTANLYAGVTPGNKAFAEYYASRPVAKGTVATNNWLDVIPHAWTQAGFDVVCAGTGVVPVVLWGEVVKGRGG